MKSQYLECGKIINKRGIGGELKLECLCDSPAVLKNVKKLYADKDAKVSYNVTSVKEYKGFVYIKLEGVTSAEKADEMRGMTLFADRDDLDIADDSYFIADLLGLDVVDSKTGKVYGKVTDILNYGASDIYVVTDGNNSYMMPSAGDIIEKVVLESHISVNPIPGIFDDAEEIR